LSSVFGVTDSLTGLLLCKSTSRKQMTDGPLGLGFSSTLRNRGDFGQQTLVGDIPTNFQLATKTAAIVLVDAASQLLLLVPSTRFAITCSCCSTAHASPLPLAAA
jgi:hypothetical protein